MEELEAHKAAAEEYATSGEEIKERYEAILREKTGIVTPAPPLRSKASEPASLEVTSRSRSYSVGTQSDDSTARKTKAPAPLHIDTERPPVRVTNIFIFTYPY